MRTVGRHWEGFDIPQKDIKRRWGYVNDWNLEDQVDKGVHDGIYLVLENIDGKSPLPFEESGKDKQNDSPIDFLSARQGQFLYSFPEPVGNAMPIGFETIRNEWIYLRTAGEYALAGLVPLKSLRKIEILEKNYGNIAARSVSRGISSGNKTTGRMSKRSQGAKPRGIGMIRTPHEGTYSIA